MGFARDLDREFEGPRDGLRLEKWPIGAEREFGGARELDEAGANTYSRYRSHQPLHQRIADKGSRGVRQRGRNPFGGQARDDCLDR